MSHDVTETHNNLFKQPLNLHAIFDRIWTWNSICTKFNQ